MAGSGVTSAASVLYDSDCAFCMVVIDALLGLGRHGGLRAVAIQSAEGEALLATVPEDRRLDSFHLVDERVRSGGTALPPLLRRLRGGDAPAAILERAPALTSAAYQWVAEHRAQISRLVPGRLKVRAARRLATPSTSVDARSGT